MTDRRGPLDDLFAEDNYEPTLAFAITAAEQAGSKLKQARELVEHFRLSYGNYTNFTARSGAKAAGSLLDEIETAAGIATEAGRLAAVATTEAEQDHLVQRAIDAYGSCLRPFDDLVHAVNAAAVEDAAPAPVVEPPLPTTRDWATVCQLTQNDTIAWLKRERNSKGKLLILKPSPGTGKTTAMIDGAIDEQAARRRVVMAARTKEVLVEELEPRFRSTRPYVRLHVITGRDRDNCQNWTNVEAVQKHGYAPARSVCLACEHHPINAPKMGQRICDYYASRIRAHNDSRAARAGANEYPIILTTHAGLVSANESGGGMYGNFWKADTVFIDEDPTEAFEPTVALDETRCSFASVAPELKATVATAATLLGALKTAEQDRKVAEAYGFRGLDKTPHPIHHRTGSVYAGIDLHALLNTIATTRLGLRDLRAMLRDTADHRAVPGAGALHGMTTATQLNTRLPPAGIARVAEALFNEMGLAASIRRREYEKILGHAPESRNASATDQEIEAEIERRIEKLDIAYQVRLEHAGQWQFVLQDFAGLATTETNVVIGDAYAQVDHYRRLFGKPAALLRDPSYVDPVTIVDHVAHFPPGTHITRIRTKSTITHLERGYLQVNLGYLEMLLAHCEGQRVLVYGHLKLRDRVEKFLADHAAKYSIIEWAYEHWWGGRGKDQYKHFDTVVCLSEPLQNFDGMVHKANARAMSDALVEPDDQRKLDMSRRIRLEVYRKHSVAHAMRNPRTDERIRHEHERQNISELAQAIHRVRGLMHPRTVLILGEEVELRRDILAATTSVAAENVQQEPTSRQQRGTLLDSPVCAYLTAEECLEAMLSVADRLGCWSHCFSHTLLLNYSTVNWRSDKEKRSLNAAPVIFLHANARTGICHAVWSPPATWERLNEVAANLYAVTEAWRQISKLLQGVRAGRNPVWCSGKRGPKPMVYYDASRSTERAALEAYYDIMDNQYGPVVGGKLYAPRSKPIVPF